ncbi:MAG: response regulator, partial [Polaromonas sp.]
MSFALYRRPGGVVFLDDDPDYLEMLAQVMPLDWYVRLFLRPVACIDLLQQEPPRWEADAWRQQEIINRWRKGASLIPQILQYWREDGTARFALTQVCVVDYAMPAMSGLRVLSELTGWSGSRVLLTGRADEQLAVSAFNRGLIEQFIPKQSPDIRLRLTGAIQGLLHLPDGRHQQTWRATLTLEQHALLCNPSIAQELDNLALSQGWIEHVVVGAPFGVLALDHKGGVSWLQLEPADNLQELAEMAESQGWDAATVEDIRTGKKLIDLELQLALGANHKPQPRQAF